MTPAAHISVGLVVGYCLPLPWPAKVIVAILSHVLVDGFAGYHPTLATRSNDYNSLNSTVWNCDTWEKKIIVGANIVGLIAAGWVVFLHPILIGYVMAAGLFDVWYIMRWLWPKAWPTLYRWSPHRWLVDWWSDWLWKGRRDWSWATWLEVGLSVLGWIVLLCG
jgi:hypothetical protein